MLDKIVAFRELVKEAASNPQFVHHKWFVQWHLEIVEKIASELCEYYPDADRELVEVMVWLHDYGKIVDFEHEHVATLSEGPKALARVGFSADFAQTAVNYIEILDKKLEVDLHEAPIEVQIVSSADGCSHMIGPFFHLYWYEHADKPYHELMISDRAKIDKDWNRKIVLPEAREAFEARYKFLVEQTGTLPPRYV